jgi:hypothetical protein
MKESAKIDLEISKEQIQSLARVLLPCLQEYLSSEQGKRILPNGRKRKRQIAPDAVCLSFYNL